MRIENRSLYSAVLLAVVCILILSPHRVCGQSLASSVGSDSITTSEAIGLVDAVLSVAGRLDTEQKEQKNLRRKMSSTKLSADEIKEIEDSLSGKRTEIKQLEEDIDNIFSGIDISQLVERKDVDFDWAKDVKEMIFPLFSELRSLTDRPREIERLKRKVDFLENRRLKAVDRALLTIAALKQKLPDVYEFGKKLQVEKKQERAKLEKELTVLKDELHEKEALLAKLKAQEKAKATPATGDASIKTDGSQQPTPPEGSQKSAQSGKQEKSAQPEGSLKPVSSDELQKTTPEPKEPPLTIGELETLIAKLREKIQDKELALVAIDGELRRVAERIEEAPVLTKLLEAEGAQWTQLRSEVADELTLSQHRLEELVEAKSPFFATIRNLISVFFRSRGRNIVVGILLAVLFALVFRKFHRWLLTTSLYAKKKVPFFLRVIDLFLTGISFVGAVVVFQFVLYFFDDWLLLAITLLFVLALVWLAAKELPAMWQQLQLMLNFGVVRDGERIVVDGLPWKVEKVNIFTKLSNPWLTGGKIRIPIQELVGYRSRPCSPDEGWFPSKEGNWVLLSDGTFGKVVLQTPESVKIVMYGGATKIYPVSDYISQIPANLSCGFSVVVTFGVDYDHQEIATTRIPEAFTEFIRSAVEEAGYKDTLNDMKVQFKEAGSSSLDLAIISTFEGSVASDYFSLQRLFQRSAVDCCTRNNWGIPFPQITVHKAQDEQ